MQVHDHETQRQSVTPSAIELLLKGLAEQPPVVKPGQRIGHGIELQGLEFVVFDDDRDTEQTRGGENIHQRRFQRDLTAEMLAQFATAREHLIPKLHALVFAQIEVRDRANVSLKKLSARG